MEKIYQKLAVLTMLVKAIKLNNAPNYSSRKKLDKGVVSFSANPTDPILYQVKKNSVLKKVLPTMAFVGSLMGSIGYLIGGSGLCYDVYLSHKNKNKNTAPQQKDSVWSKSFPKADSTNKKPEGVKTVVPETKFSKIGMKLTKIGIASSSIAGASCGIVEGIPTMTIGELTNISSSSIIETPIGTGLFGIGIASIFSGLALDNTPELKLNSYKLMATKGIFNKTKLIGKSVIIISKEIGSSVSEIAKNTFSKNSAKFWKENFLSLTPKTVVFQEKINRNGRVVVEKTLRHNKNYLMHAASFTLGIGGLGIILSSLLNFKKAQKAGLKVEEGGFLFDNFGITKYGIDKMTTNGKSAGISFATGGVINAVSQFMGIDNKDGRALQWLGIALVFLGYSIDRGKTLRSELKKLKAQPELTDVLREWKLDLREVFSDKKTMNAVLKAVKHGKPVENESFNSIENALKKALNNTPDNIPENLAEKLDEKHFKFKKTNDIRNAFEENLPQNLKDISQKVKEYNIADEDVETGFEDTKNVLKYCTKRIFGTENPAVYSEK